VCIVLSWYDPKKKNYNHFILASTNPYVMQNSFEYLTGLAKLRSRDVDYDNFS
jgi:hypothetical protein